MVSIGINTDTPELSYSLPGTHPFYQTHRLLSINAPLLLRFNHIIMSVDLHGAYEFMPLCPLIVAGPLYCIILLVFLVRSVHSIHSHRCCFFLLLSVLSQQSVFLRVSFTLHNMPWPYGISCSLLPHQTVFFNSNSLLRSIGRSAASSYCPVVQAYYRLASSLYYRGTQPS
jgi:hypothetical protein